MIKAATNFQGCHSDFERKTSNRRDFSPQNISWRFSGIGTSEPDVQTAFAGFEKGNECFPFSTTFKIRKLCYIAMS